MRVMAATRHDASSYYRILSPFSILQYRGVDVKIGRPSIREVGAFDVLWMHQHADAEMELLAREYKDAGKRLVYDLDDWLFAIPPSWHSYDYYYERGTGEPRNALGFHQRLIQMADVVTVTTEYLAQKVRGRFPGTDVRVLPNCIMAGDWEMLERIPHTLDGPVVGWFGTGNHWDDWVEIAPIVDQVLDDAGGYLALMGAPEVMACFPKRLAERTQVHPLMTVDRLPMLRLLISACDLGLAWVSDGVEAGLSRSPLKVLQWGAAGVPVVASRTVYGDLDQTRFSTDLNRLAADLHRVLTDAESDRQAEAGVWREIVFRQHSYETQALRWLEVATSLS